MTTLGAYELDAVYCVDALTLLAGLPDASVDAIITDPPYGCGTQVSARRSPEFRFDEIAGVYAIDPAWLTEAFRVLKNESAMYVFAKWVNDGEWKAFIREAGFIVRNCIIWDKLQHGTGDLEGDYAPQYEMILYATKGRHILRGNRTPNIFRYPKVQPIELRHPYEKPVGLLERLVLKSTDAGGVVVDCFAGSGATLQAATKRGRHFIGGDISAEYVALANKRLALPFTPYMFEETP